MIPKLLLPILIYIFIGVSISSCLARCDYNVFFAFGLLLLFRVYYNKDLQYYSKIILHILTGLSIADIIWMIIFIPYWNTDNPNLAWNKIAGIRMYTIVTSFIELGLKLVIGWLVFSDYKEKHNNDLGYLVKFDYMNVQNNMKKGDFF